MAITTVQMDLSLVAPEATSYWDAGDRIKANLYKVAGIERKLSMSELVMAICLQRATKLEADVIGMMENMNVATVDLEVLTEVQERLVEKNSLSDFGTFENVSYYPADANGNLLTVLATTGTIANQSQLMEWLGPSTSSVKGMGVKDLDKAKTVADFVSAIGSRMDALNSLNQEEMIELQSATNKRDQTYDMITNLLKSFHNTLMGTINNY